MRLYSEVETIIMTGRGGGRWEGEMGGGSGRTYGIGKEGTEMAGR